MTQKFEWVFIHNTVTLKRKVYRNFFFIINKTTCIRITVVFFIFKKYQINVNSVRKKNNYLNAASTEMMKSITWLCEKVNISYFLTRIDHNVLASNQSLSCKVYPWTQRKELRNLPCTLFLNEKRWQCRFIYFPFFIICIAKKNQVFYSRSESGDTLYFNTVLLNTSWKNCLTIFIPALTSKPWNVWLLHLNSEILGSTL